ncbi:MAG TPA: hypothetical protein VNO31_04030 [Umezawaea sp.]|jgi:hypothetical protein|nr:hypothetical protein [Umezawaea sp.]
MDDAKLIEADLLARMMPLLQRAGRLTGVDLMMQTNAGPAIRDLAARLAHDPPSPSAAQAVMNVLYPNEDPPLPWWTCAAGKAVARAIGYHRQRVPVLQAAAVLGVTRTRVYQLMNEGLLVRVALCPFLAVTSSSLQAEQANRRARARALARARARRTG